jgi:hypothetical protein
VDQAAIPYEGHDSEAQVEDLAFRKMLAQAVEGFLRRLPMVAGKYLGETDRRLFRRGQLFAIFKIRDFGDQFFGQSLLPCQGKPGAESQAAFIFLRYLEASQLRQPHVDGSARGTDQREVEIDEGLENLGRMGEDLNESGAAEFHVILVHDRLKLWVNFFKRDRT